MFLKKIHPPLEQALEDIGFEQPNSLQKSTFPLAKSGANVWSIAEDEKGKSTTLAICVIQKLKEAVGDIPRAILLAKNIDHGEELEGIVKTLASHTDLRVYHTYRGRDITRDRDAIYMGMDIVIGTAQRLNDIYLANGLNYRDLKVYGIDKADDILKPEVITQVDKFTDRLPKCQYLLFGSAKTKGIERFIDRYLEVIQVV